ncbi:YeeE/YedE family protein [Lutibaculum baratangense]|uniref:Lipocalin-related protein and Bos/Can/Equ allergen n=1 Tax=Lutibaculum baratangense AMV1 TaxID=631454 RepID=V4RW77_9HYPH|nr:YeeE/YedE family protein [Lutibaculum baratangense]ESR27275.1 Lipocalin-related protein and Bos/Can/Equ allergen [Lutibaculum baratangense AMV1]
MEGLEAQLWLPLVGLFAGTILGYAARVSRFCTLSALERHWYAGDSTGLRTWVLATASAIIATQALSLAGLIDLSSSFYLSSSFGLSGAVIGGLLFGFGMALVGTCGFGAVVRLGGGSLRSLIVLLVLGLAALATQRGVMGQVRVLAVDDMAINLSFAGDQSLGSIVSAVLGADLHAPVAMLVAGSLLVWVFRDGSYRRRPRIAAAGIVIGLVIAFGWLATSLAAGSSFAPVQIEAGSFVVPVGDLILQIIAVTGTWPDYGVGLVAGTLVGAALGAWRRRDVRWEACDDARELGRHLTGGAMMGIGGVFAMGCTVGQGLSAASALAISAPVAMASIALGARMGLGWLLEGSAIAPFRRPGLPAE